ncbi:MAG TPA: glycosyltransferase family 4 protein [Candidatus Saccharimonadales bacterium]|nr:glycosyltransferase family 4 protein [Candidatus Saccharimonadales bacterium]
MKNRANLSVAFLFDDTLDSNDGVAQQVKRLGEYLSRHGHKVIYLCGQSRTREWAGGKVYSLSKNIHVRFNGNRLSMPIFSSRKMIRDVINSEKLDIVHVTAPYSPLMAQRVIASAHRQNIAVVGSFHILPSGWLSSIGTRLLGYVQFFSLRKVQAFTSTSRNASVFAKRAMRINSIVVPNAVDINKFKPGQKQKITRAQIVFLGRLVERKGCEQLIRAFHKLASGNPEATLVVAGDGPERRRLERLTSQLGLSDKVKFLGFISEEDKPKILGSAQIACFPSLYGESFGLVLIEAMAAGSKIVLAGDNPGYRSVLGGQPELLIDPRDTDQFASRLSELLRDNKHNATLHDWLQSEIKQYDIEVVGARLVELYRQTIALADKTSHNYSYVSKSDRKRH